MKLLAEISDGSLGIGPTEALGAKYELRKSARCILFNEDGKIAVQYLQNHLFHKLPGGGVENGETIEEALVREVQEEVGCVCEIGEPIGITIEYRKQHELLHISYCYTGKVCGEMTEPQMEQGEIDEGMVTLWMTPEEAIAKMESDEPNTYQGPFILARELAFLGEFIGR